MKESKKNNNNDVHLYGYINGVRMNETKDGRMAINLNVATIETFKQGDEFKNRYTFHDVSLFTKDEALIEKFSGIAEDVVKNLENKDVKGYKAKSHTVSLDGSMIQPAESNGIRIIAKEASIDLDVKQADKEVRNRAEIVGNIASVDLYEEKNFAVVSIAHHIPGKDDPMYIKVRVDGGRKDDLFKQLAGGELEKGDFIKVRGQLHNNDFEGEKGKVYGMALDANKVELLHKKGEAVKETAEKAPEKKAEKAPAKKAEKAPEKKAEKAPAKKAVSNRTRKKGVSM